jgi:two-component system copper resistance phosphate regulon response regulator CusR
MTKTVKKRSTDRAESLPKLFPHQNLKAPPPMSHTAGAVLHPEHVNDCSNNSTTDPGFRDNFRPADSKRTKFVLVAEDDEPLAAFLRAELEAQNFVVDLVHDGEDAFLAVNTKRRYDLVIVDLNLPKLDGIELIMKVRPTQPRLPVLVLTARNTVEDKVNALQRGADDCLTKPFSMLELLARIHALVRRNSGVVPNMSQVADLTLLREERRVERNGRRIELTPREFALLEVLMRNAGKPVSRATLHAEVWNMPAERSTNIVDVYMKYVRDKVDLPGETRLTHTIRGVGYELREG